MATLDETIRLLERAEEPPDARLAHALARAGRKDEASIIAARAIARDPRQPCRELIRPSPPRACAPFLGPTAVELPVRNTALLDVGNGLVAASRGQLVRVIDTVTLRTRWSKRLGGFVPLAPLCDALLLARIERERALELVCRSLADGRLLGSWTYGMHSFATNYLIETQFLDEATVILIVQGINAGDGATWNLTFDRENGWAPIAARSDAPLCVASGLVVVESDGAIVALDRGSHLKWTRPSWKLVGAAPGGILAIGEHAARAFLLDTRTGVTRAETRLGGPNAVFVSGAVATDSVVAMLVNDGLDRDIVGLDASSLEILWRRRAPAHIGSFAATLDVVAWVVPHGTTYAVFAFDPARGTRVGPLWHPAREARLDQRPTLVGGRLLMPSNQDPPFVVLRVSEDASTSTRATARAAGTARPSARPRPPRRSSPTRARPRCSA